MDKNKNEYIMKVLFTGGGTIGGVSPLIAVKNDLQEKYPDMQSLWIGSEHGVEKDFVKKQGIEYRAIKTGKLRRYFSWQTFVEPFRIFYGTIQARKIIKNFQPDLILSAGGFVCVPAVLAGNWLKIKTVVHQQDVRKGLANKILTRFATKVTVTFEDSMKDFPENKTVLTGNPVRQNIFRGDREQALAKFNLQKDLPTLFICGGSLGAQKINELMTESITRLIEFCQIVHLTGKDNLIEWVDRDKFSKADRYHAYEFFNEEMPDAYAIADLVVARAGLSTLTELTALTKPAIIVPIPNNQQEDNANYFVSKNAVMSLSQKSVTADEFVELIHDLFDTPSSLQRLSNNIKDMMPRNANENYLKLIEDLMQ